METKTKYLGPPKSFYKRFLNTGDEIEIVHFDKKNKIVFVKEWGWFDVSLVEFREFMNF